MDKKTIFFAVFESSIGKSDRLEIFEEYKTKIDFFNWIKKNRTLL